MRVQEARDLGEAGVSKALKAGASYAEARVQATWEREFGLKNGEPQPSVFVEGYGIGIRVIAGGALGFAATNAMHRTSVGEVAAKAVRLAKASGGMLRRPVVFDSTKPARTSWAAPETEKIESADSTWMKEVLMDIDGRVADGRAGVKLTGRIFYLSAELQERYFVSSDGARVAGRVPRVSFGGSLTAVEAGSAAQRFIQQGETGGLEVVKRVGLVEKVVEEATAIGKVLKASAKPPTEEIDVVLGPELSGIAAHESVGHPQEADRVLGREGAQAGESYLKADSLGRKIGSDEANVSDDPTLLHSNGYVPVDDEGVAAKKRSLIKGGVINEFLQNRATARQFGVGSNGAARAVAFDREPIIRMANTFVEPGDYSTDEIFEEVKHGVYFKSFTEWNIDDKRLNQRYVGLEAYLVDHGELKGLVRSPVLEITTPKLWGSVKARSKHMEFEAATCGKGDPMQGAPVWTGGPETLLAGIRLGAR
ncbi:MAG: TldD/PmbA family protein [Nitrososphaerota archaeon]|jgi:TldD protein|nr:TldD/PmbA family protein [Nitrososphaerota archaeon]